MYFMPWYRAERRMALAQLRLFKRDGHRFWSNGENITDQIVLRIRSWLAKLRVLRARHGAI
jgi:hypothetical protein